MKIMLATLCLNEMEWLPKLFSQHKLWPDVDQWVFVEAADVVYATTNPGLVTSRGLSTDGTTAFLEKLAADFPGFVTHIKKGFVEHKNLAQCKIVARNAYLEVADETEPDWVVVLDADEFYTRSDQAKITRILAGGLEDHPLLLLQRNIWKAPSMLGGLFLYEAVGGYWGVPHLRIWPFSKGTRYTENHNYLVTAAGLDLANRKFDVRRISGSPQCVHMAFASSGPSRKAKHAYYVARGEGQGDGRNSYVECRAAWERWKFGQPLPHNGRVLRYEGPIPECFASL